MASSDEHEGVAALAERYPVWLCDVWGVVHDGIARFAPAVAALQRFREAGGCVVLLTNAPRPASHVADQMAGLGVSRDAYDVIVTSGDATRDFVIEHGHRKVLHIGPARDLGFFEGLEVERVDEVEAECVVCTGFFDELTEHPNDYRDRFAACVARGLPFYCANPDTVVRRGDDLLPCAGALAEVYAALGGHVEIAGKPHAPIYARALRLAEGVRNAPVPQSGVLVIGDGIETDMRGAAIQGFHALFVLDGIHAAELGLDGETLGPEQRARVRRELAARVGGLECVGVLPQLGW